VKVIKSVAILLAALALNACGAAASSSVQTPAPVVLRGQQWNIKIDPASLGIWGLLPGTNEEIILAAPAATTAEITDLKTSERQMSWRTPRSRMQVDIRLSESDLSVRFTTDREQVLVWPETGTDAKTRALIWPESEGLYIPIDDPFWLSRPAEECRDAFGSLMPFGGTQLQSATIAYILPDELRCQLCLEKAEARLSLKATHQFLQRDGFPAYEVKIVLAQNSPLGPALAYRDWLIKAGRHVSFAEKVKEAPEAGKLLGAMHAYLWGDGKLKPAMDQLHGLGVERAALFYDQDPRTQATLVKAETIAAAKSYGYVIGPYDTFDNIQDPKTSDSFTSVFDEALYRTGSVMKQDGDRLIGFGERGYELSSEALKRAARPFFAERVNAHLQTGVNGYFLDVDAAGDLHDDFDPQHPMTLAQDRANRLERMRFISQQKKLVLGSESAAAWSTPVIHFSHGSLTPKSLLLWKLLRNQELIGGYWPPERPRNKFLAVEAPADFATFTFDPQYRLPLYEAVFHDSIISTDFWGVPLMKFKNLVQTRMLLLLLYNAPAIWHLDQKALREDGSRIKVLNAFFSPLHRRIGGEPLARFEWLTGDRLVQQTQFGDQVVMTANFSDHAFGSIPPHCVEAHWLKEHRRESFCPEP
jgi:hypothetical protein